MSKTKHERKKWLTRHPNEGGAIRISLGRGSFERDDGKKLKDIFGTLTIQDCGRQISLDVWADDKKTLEQRISKMSVLIDELQAAKDWLEDQREWFDQ